jgi:hypothetical protein
MEDSVKVEVRNCDGGRYEISVGGEFDGLIEEEAVEYNEWELNGRYYSVRRLTY